MRALRQIAQYFANNVVPAARCSLEPEGNDFDWIPCSPDHWPASGNTSLSICVLHTKGWFPLPDCQRVATPLNIQPGPAEAPSPVFRTKLGDFAGCFANGPGRQVRAPSIESIKRRTFRMRISRSPVNVDINARVSCCCITSERQFRMINNATRSTLVALGVESATHWS